MRQTGILAAAGLLVIYAINTWLQYVVTYWGHMLGINIETDMRRKAFDHIQKLSFRFFDNNKTGHLLARDSAAGRRPLRPKGVMRRGCVRRPRRRTGGGWSR